MRKLILLLPLFIASHVLCAQKPVGFYIKRAYNKISLLDYEGALRDYNSALEIDPDHVGALINRATLKATQLHDYIGAFKDFERAIELQPDQINPYYNRGMILKDNADYKGAITDFSKVIELQPNMGSAYYNRGWAYYMLKQNENACADWSLGAQNSSEQSASALKEYCP